VVPDIAGSGDRKWPCMSNNWANYREESFISQFLSPRLIRRCGCSIADDPEEKRPASVRASMMNAATVGFRRRMARSTTSGNRSQHTKSSMLILPANRPLMLRHAVVKGAQTQRSTRRVLQTSPDLWSYDRIAGRSGRPPRRFSKATS